jgi:type I restriction enzyme S subunit
MTEVTLEKEYSTATPEGWVNANLEDVVDILDSRRVPVNAKDRQKRRGTIPYYGATGQVGWIDDYLFNEELILLGEDGAPFLEPTKQKAYIIRGKSWVNNHAHVLRARNGIPNAYIKYYLDIVDYHKFVSGTTRLKLNQSAMRQIPVPIAPPNQQKLIVAEIEKQCSRLDEALTALKRIQANLKRYKASVLKAAVEGKLTEQWRKEHPDVETANELLKRVLIERRKKWEGDYIKKFVRAHGHAPKDDSWKKKYKEPAPPDISNLPKLPKAWVWATVEQLAKNESNAIKAGPFGSSLKKSFYVPKGFKIYGQEQVLRDDPYFGDYYIDKHLYEKLKSCAVQPGDILVSLVGTIGRVLILPKNIEPGIINPRLVKLSLNNRIMNAKFIKAYIQSPYVKHLFSLSSHGGTMDILNLTILKKIPIPLPPLDEQNVIMDELERIFSVEWEIELTIDTNQKRAERLRQAILRSAFAGRGTIKKSVNRIEGGVSF